MQLQSNLPAEGQPSVTTSSRISTRAPGGTTPAKEEVAPQSPVNRLHSFVPSPVARSLAKRCDRIDFGRPTSRE
jgi:hypothetical protein